MGELLDLVCLALHDGGLLTLNELHFRTGIAYPALRSHLHLGLGERYCRVSVYDPGEPPRHYWYLAPPKMVEGSTDEL